LRYAAAAAVQQADNLFEIYGQPHCRVFQSQKRTLESFSEQKQTELNVIGRGESLSMDGEIVALIHFLYVCGFAEMNAAMESDQMK